WMARSVFGYVSRGAHDRPPGSDDVPGSDENGSILAAAGKAGAKGVVIGGGLLGLEAAAAHPIAGWGSGVLHLLERQLDRQQGICCAGSWKRAASRFVATPRSRRTWKMVTVRPCCWTTERSTTPTSELWRSAYVLRRGLQPGMWE